MSNYTRTFFRCLAFCTAATYNLPAIASYFKQRHYLVKLARNVLHVCRPDDAGDIFFFSHGCFVSWGLRQRAEAELLELLPPYSNSPLSKFESARFCFRYGEKTRIAAHDRFNMDVITLDSDSPQLKLAISYGLAQSIKLETHEESIQQTIRKNSELPAQIAKLGAIPLSRRAISTRMGEIFIARSSINLSSEYLDVPEYFWQNPSQEVYYVMTEKFLDISQRVAALNQKLDVLQEFFDMLASQLQHRHSSMLELIIIILIAIEIVISLVHWV